MKTKLLVAVALFNCLLSFAQQPAKRACGSMEHLNRLKNEDPMLESRMQEIESLTNAYIHINKNRIEMNSVITIPVVFHIVYNSPSQNITDAKCQAQVAQLNLDFARMNSDASNTPGAFQGLAANTDIQFCLASRNPSGAATNGIERRQTTVTSFSTNDNVKYTTSGGMNAWPVSSYLNIWVANLGGGVLGYAQFPGGPAATDGVVLLYSSVGSMLSPGSLTNYNLGRTATHEVGHWLNLIHIWGDESGCLGSDNVGDTPNQGSENYGCPTFPVLDGCAGTSPGVMYMNYMDYTDDACMNMFSAGQSTRMNALFTGGGFRVSLATSQGCQAPVAGCASPTGLNATPTATGATLNWTAVSGAVTYTIHYKKSSVSSWSTTTSNTNSKLISGLTSSTIYQWQVQTVCGTGGSAYSATTTFTTAPPAACGTVSSLSSSMISANAATMSWAALSGATSYNIQYQVTGALTWTTSASSTISKAVTGLTAGTNYTFQGQGVCASGPGSYSTTASFTTTASNCTDNNEPNNSYLSPAVVSMNTDISGLISATNDADWFRITTIAPNTKLSIVLSNLPKDYDLRLYSASLSLLGISQNKNLMNEVITKNFTAAGTYFIQVNGYNGANNSIQCYNLRINNSNINFRTSDESEQLSLNETRQSDLVLYPNPVHDNLNCIFNSTVDQTVTVRVFDMVGKTVTTMPIEATEGENKFSLDFYGLNKGIYFVEVIEPTNKITKKIIVN